MTVTSLTAVEGLEGQVLRLAHGHTLTSDRGDFYGNTGYSHPDVKLPELKPVPYVCCEQRRCKSLPVARLTAYLGSGKDTGRIPEIRIPMSHINPGFWLITNLPKIKLHLLSFARRVTM